MPPRSFQLHFACGRRLSSFEFVTVNRGGASRYQRSWCLYQTARMWYADAITSFTLCLGAHVGKKQDLWYVVDLLTGEKQQTLTSSFAEMLCPSSSLLYLGRTGKSTIAHKHPQCSQPTQLNGVAAVIWLISSHICFVHSSLHVSSRPLFTSSSLPTPPHQVMMCSFCML